MNQRKPKPHLNWIANCHNALDFSVYPCEPHRGDYLLFLGRLSPDKGAHRAVAVAIETGLPLKIAGKMQEPKERSTSTSSSSRTWSTGSSTSAR